MSFYLGDEVFVRGPTRFVVDATCIVGPIVKITINSYGVRYWVDAEVCSKEWPNYRAEMPFKAADIGHQIGTPVRQISGRPVHPGFGEFCRIARSWGYD